MLILIIFAMNTKKPLGSYVNLFTINWLNLDKPLGVAVRIIRIRNLVDEAWNYKSRWSRVALLPSLNTLLLNKNNKNSHYFYKTLFGKPTYAILPLFCWSFYVEKMWHCFHLKWEMEIWKWKDVASLSKCSLPLLYVIHCRTHFSWPLVFPLHLVLSLIKF